MRRKVLLSFYVGLIGVVLLNASALRAASPSGLLTAREQALLLQGAGVTGTEASTAVGGTASSQQQFLSDLERTIRRANPGMDSQSLRQPVSESALRKLQVRSALRGNFMSQQELRAATDYAHALLRESPGVSLAEKVEKLPMQQRKAFHGDVAEVAEARARGMVLTKSRTSPMWDLTEAKFGPQNLQMKIYAQPGRALSELLSDLEKQHAFIKAGVLTQDTLERLVKSGQLVRDGGIYRPVGRTDIEIHPSKVFSRPAESSLYAKTGRQSLMKQGLPGEGVGPSGFETAGKWLGRAGVVALIATEAYEIHGFATGRLSEREFFTTQSAIAGGAGGAWAGAETGALIGTALVGGPEDPLALIAAPVGALIGGFAGGFGGAKLGEMAASGFYGRLDERQKQQVGDFIYQYYNVTR
jgi:hypothetical protein